MKRLFNILMAIVVLFTLTVSAATNGSITINRNATRAGVTYDAYKVLDLTFNNDTKSYAYTTNTKWAGFINSLTNGTDINKTIANGVTYVTGVADAKDFAEKALAYAQENNIKPEKTVEAAADATSVSMTGLELGYYVVDSSLGALVSLNTTDYDAVIFEKNGEPGFDKELVNLGDAVTQIGKNISYDITVNVTPGSENYVVSDKMSAGLQNNKDYVVKFDDVVTKDYVVTTSEDNEFVISFADSNLSNVKQIVVTYSAHVTAEAVTLDTVHNNSTLTFGQNNTVNSTPVESKLYGLNFKKVAANDTTVVLDANFTLWDAASNGNQIQVVFVNETDGVKYYRVADTTDRTYAERIEAGKAVIMGLDNETVYLQEEEVPEGYQRLAERMAVTPKENYKEATAQFTVDNVNGVQLPSTGGMGTVLFVALGSMIAMAFGVVLVAKYRMSKMF